jgi:hypothetical protein
MMTAIDATLGRLGDQINWYNDRSNLNQWCFKGFKLVEFLVAGSIPLVAAFGLSNVLTATMGALIVFIESVVHLFQFQQNWLTYRTTCEELKHEKYLFSAEAGLYAMSDGPEQLLAERVESLISKEHAKWSAVHEQQSKSKEGGARVS